jgi:hypothetical protein
VVVSAERTDCVSVLNIVSTVIGIVGGLLGLFVFIDNYLLKFRPSITIANTLYLIFGVPNTPAPLAIQNSYLKSFICSLDIFNHRNKVGRIDDFMIRIYNSGQINATVYNIFPGTQLDELPRSSADIGSLGKSPGTPISVPNKSGKKTVIEFVGDKYSTCGINPEETICFELHYKDHKGKWIKADEYTLEGRFEKPEIAGSDKVYSLNLWELSVERYGLAKRPMRRKVTIYRGLAHYYLGWWIRKPYYFIVRMLAKVGSLCRLSVDIASALIRYFYSEFVVYTLLRLKGRNLIQYKMSFGNKSASDITDRTILEMEKVMQEKITEINGSAAEQAKIAFKKEDGKLFLSRHKRRVKIYRGGDGYIVIQEWSPSNMGLNVLFNVNLKFYPLGATMWIVNKKGAMSIKSICTKTLDYLIFHSNY